MPIYISQGRYNSDAIRGLMGKPEDRTEEVSKLIAAAGGKLHGFYYTLGEYDFMLIAEAPSEKAAIAAALVVGATGTVTDQKTTIAITGGEMKQCLTNAASVAETFRAAGK